MIIGHCSDLHGNLNGIFRGSQKPDVWVLSGDICPNLTRGQVSVEVPFQKVWFAKQAPILAKRFADRPVVVVGGNHDYIDLAELLLPYGVDAVTLTPEGAIVAGVRFAGFREIPYMRGEWNGECRDFSDIVDRTFNSDPEIIVTHAPPAGILDDDGLGAQGHGYGISALTNSLMYRPNQVRAHLFGHIHEHGGEDVKKFGIHFINGATCVRFIAVEDSP